MKEDDEDEAEERTEKTKGKLDTVRKRGKPESTQLIHPTSLTEQTN